MGRSYKRLTLPTQHHSSGPAPEAAGIGCTSDFWAEVTSKTLDEAGLGEPLTLLLDALKVVRSYQPNQNRLHHALRLDAFGRVVERALVQARARRVLSRLQLHPRSAVTHPGSKCAQTGCPETGLAGNGRGGAGSDA